MPILFDIHPVRPNRTVQLGQLCWRVPCCATYDCHSPALHRHQLDRTLQQRGCPSGFCHAVDDGVSFLLRPQPFRLLATEFSRRSFLDLAAHRHRESFSFLCGSGAGHRLEARAGVGPVWAALAADCWVCAASDNQLVCHVSAELYLFRCAARHGGHAAGGAFHGGLGALAVAGGAGCAGAAVVRAAAADGGGQSGRRCSMHAH